MKPPSSLPLSISNFSILPFKLLLLREFSCPKLRPLSCNSTLEIARYWLALTSTCWKFVNVIHIILTIFIIIVLISVPSVNHNLLNYRRRSPCRCHFVLAASNCNLIIISVVWWVQWGQSYTVTGKGTVSILISYRSACKHENDRQQANFGLHAVINWWDWLTKNTSGNSSYEEVNNLDREPHQLVNPGNPSSLAWPAFL